MILLLIAIFPRTSTELDRGGIQQRNEWMDEWMGFYVNYFRYQELYRDIKEAQQSRVLNRYIG